MECLFASGETHSIKELVEYAFNYVSFNGEDYVSLGSTFYRPNEEVQLGGSIEKFKNNLGWQPQSSFAQLVELIVDYDLKNLIKKLKFFNSIFRIGINS